MIPTFLILIMLSLLRMNFAAPHTGMVNNEYVRDVGAVYREVGYDGDANFLLSVRPEPACIPFNGNIASVMVCVPAVCTFNTDSNCGIKEGEGSETFTVAGPGDVQEVPEHLRSINYNSYLYASGGLNLGTATGGEALKTTPHDASKDKTTAMK